MPALELFLHEQRVGTLTPMPRDATRVALQVDPDYRQEILLSESFATLPGRRPASDAVSSFLGGYVPEGNHRERMAAKRRIDKDDLFALLSEFGGSIAGAVTLRPQEEASPYRPTYEPLSDRGSPSTTGTSSAARDRDRQADGRHPRQRGTGRAHAAVDHPGDADDDGADDRGARRGSDHPSARVLFVDYLSVLDDASIDATTCTKDELGRFLTIQRAIGKVFADAAARTGADLVLASALSLDHALGADIGPAGR